jgi:hypothetical protein
MSVLREPASVSGPMGLVLYSAGESPLARPVSTSCSMEAESFLSLPASLPGEEQSQRAGKRRRRAARAAQESGAAAERQQWFQGV